MANLYYNAAVDVAWDTLGNWWTDASFTIPSVAIPTTGDTVYLAAGMTSGPSTAVTLAHIYVADASTGGGGFGVAFTGATGDATFNDSSSNNGTVTGDATFNYSQNTGTVTGDATFNDYGNNFGPVTGDATFNDYSVNFNTVTGDATFNNYSYNNNGGTVTGDATFNDSSYNGNGGIVSGNATFSTTSAAIQITNAYYGTYGSVTIESGTAGSGDQMIARLLNLPWFINL